MVLPFRYHRRLEAEVNVNVQGTNHVVKAAQDHGCRALVYTSSCTVVTDEMGHKFADIDETWPVSQRLSIYGESKVKAEKIVLTANDRARKEDGVVGKIWVRRRWAQVTVDMCLEARSDLW